MMEKNQTILTGKEQEQYELYQKDKQEVLGATLQYALTKFILIGIFLGIIIGMVLGYSFFDLLN